MTLPIVLDVDTGTDDALAILYAVSHPDLNVLGISCVAGNSGLDQVVINTHKVLDAVGAPDIPVAAGARQPLIERARPEGAFHGVDGLGGIALPDSARQPRSESAVDMLREVIMGSADPVTLVALAPQTNIAMLLTLYPEVIERLTRIVFMGGSASIGNMTAVAEFNVWQDPEAATCVIESPAPTAMYGLDVFTRLAVDRATADRFCASTQPAINLAGELLYRRGARSDRPGRDYVGLIGDAGALVYLTNPELFQAREFPVRVNLSGIGRGQTIVDRRPAAQDAAADPWPRIQVVLDGDLTAAADQFVATIDRNRD
ncbi:MAG TPA: nucleoside hydrolase [Propionibacteriaceae bacterium]|nr:nucleoside hydrolase [Propionibacteriaceae bacterium]